MPETTEQEIGFDRYFRGQVGQAAARFHESRKCSILGMGLFCTADSQPASHGFTLYFDTTFRDTMGLQD
jgi:hypothetical protein